MKIASCILPMKYGGEGEAGILCWRQRAEFLPGKPGFIRYFSRILQIMNDSVKSVTPGGENDDM